MRASITIMTTLSVVAFARSAAGDEHFTEVSEILLSDGGDDAVQFVELVDPMAEPFPEEYQLALYDEQGDLVGRVPIDPPPGTTRYLVATAEAEAAFDFTADAELTEMLAPEGQLCFEALEDGETEVVSCLDWGCPSKLVMPLFANGHGMAPETGMSLQLQPSGVYHVGLPTPDDVNEPGDATQLSCTPDDDDDDDDGDSMQDDDGGDGGGCSAAGANGGGVLALAALGILIGLRRRRAS